MDDLLCVSVYRGKDGKDAPEKAPTQAKLCPPLIPLARRGTGP